MDNSELHILCISFYIYTHKYCDVMKMSNYFDVFCIFEIYYSFIRVLRSFLLCNCYFSYHGVKKPLEWCETNLLGFWMKVFCPQTPLTSTPWTSTLWGILEQNDCLKQKSLDFLKPASLWRIQARNSRVTTSRIHSVEN